MAEKQRFGDSFTEERVFRYRAGGRELVRVRLLREHAGDRPGRVLADSVVVSVGAQLSVASVLSLLDSFGLLVRYDGGGGEERDFDWWREASSVPEFRSFAEAATFVLEKLRGAVQADPSFSSGLHANPYLPIGWDVGWDKESKKVLVLTKDWGRARLACEEGKAFLVYGWAGLSALEEKVRDLLDVFGRADELVFDAPPKDPRSGELPPWWPAFWFTEGEVDHILHLLWRRGCDFRGRFVYA
ncbi:MAG: hypothetical protein H5T99_00065 [Moorella sp. (in: Bacteria)]|nr:hypothetical protein [Moorella sp. (in: firmicutes)]